MSIQKLTRAYVIDISTLNQTYLIWFDVKSKNIYSSDIQVVIVLGSFLHVIHTQSIREV
jgi:bifunctional pyridoxal-dependent enzyme with beta-cystathionase and maltose regulon repressor activities